MTAKSLIERVQELRVGISEYENDADLIINLRKAAPDLLDVLSGFQEGDAARLEAILHVETETAKFAARFGTVPGQILAGIDMLKRLQESARKMEEKR